MGDHRIRRQGQQPLHCIPYLFGSPALAIIIKIVFIHQIRVDTCSCTKQAMFMIAGVRTFADWNCMYPAQEQRNGVHDSDSEIRG